MIWLKFYKYSGACVEDRWCGTQVEPQQTFWLLCGQLSPASFSHLVAGGKREKVESDKGSGQSCYSKASISAVSVDVPVPSGSCNFAASVELFKPPSVSTGYEFLNELRFPIL